MPKHAYGIQMFEPLHAIKNDIGNKNTQNRHFFLLQSLKYAIQPSIYSLTLCFGKIRNRRFEKIIESLFCVPNKENNNKKKTKQKTKTENKNTKKHAN